MAGPSVLVASGKGLENYTREQAVGQPEATVNRLVI